MEVYGGEDAHYRVFIWILWRTFHGNCMGIPWKHHGMPARHLRQVHGYGEPMVQYLKAMGDRRASTIKPVGDPSATHRLRPVGQHCKPMGNSLSSHGPVI